MFKDKVLLITGGTGSFGSTLLRKFANSDLKEIRVFSRDEKKQEDLRIELKNDKINFIIGDVRDFHSINTAMEGVDYVFKQVPSCEFYPMQAIQTNILGSENVLEAAVHNRVKRVVVLSTDKAVYPINTMGMTKSLMEKLCINKARMPQVKENGGVFCCTRYGNVMCSRGSIIPLFISQIKSGQPLTVTEPNMTRFMMSLDDWLCMPSNMPIRETFSYKKPRLLPLKHWRLPSKSFLTPTMKSRSSVPATARKCTNRFAAKKR